MFAAFLRVALWPTPDRLRAYVTILLLAGAAMTAWTLAGPGLADPMGRPIGTDFLSFWTVSWALLHGWTHAIYHPRALAGLEQAMVHSAHTAFYAWEIPAHRATDRLPAGTSSLSVVPRCRWRRLSDGAVAHPAPAADALDRSCLPRCAFDHWPWSECAIDHGSARLGIAPAAAASAAGYSSGFSASNRNWRCWCRWH